MLPIIIQKYRQETRQRQLLTTNTKEVAKIVTSVTESSVNKYRWKKNALFLKTEIDQNNLR